LGYEVVEVSQDEHHAQVVCKNLETHQLEEYSARFVVGADGANSLVRQSIDADWFNKGFAADWLVVDIIPHGDASHNIPKEAIQHCNPERPTTIAPAGFMTVHICDVGSLCAYPTNRSKILKMKQRFGSYLNLGSRLIRRP
jgi:2-polyprenyl-6-methoxyphenol hydroxylase-like FAD-dependent oxidoreductase